MHAWDATLLVHPPMMHQMRSLQCTWPAVNHKPSLASAAHPLRPTSSTKAFQRCTAAARVSALHTGGGTMLVSSWRLYPYAAHALVAQLEIMCWVESSAQPAVHTPAANAMTRCRLLGEMRDAISPRWWWRYALGRGNSAALPST
jgi:hypothetical protein